MNVHGKDIKIFSGNASEDLAKEIARLSGLPLGKSSIDRFADTEVCVTINESVRGSDVFVVQSTCCPVNERLVELLVMIDAFVRASAGRITAVIPYFGYARQDRKTRSRDPISAKLVANLLTTAGADRVLTIDLHAAQIQGFFDIPVDHLSGVPLMAPYYSKKLAQMERDELVVVSPDLGSVTRARKFSDRLDASLAIIDKRRPRANECEVMNVIGEVSGKTAVLVDDLIDTAGTLCNGAQALMDRGAKAVYACATHGVLSPPAIERIAASPISELLLLDTIPLPKEKQLDKITTLSVAPVLAEAIFRIYNNKPVTPLFV